jgi:ribosome maturation factor RimP
MRRHQNQLWQLFEPVVNGMGYQLVEIEYQPGPKHGVLRLYIDHEDGILVEDCSDVSEQISALIDVEDPLPGSYNLEISSPGMDRPLRKREDFVRFAGEKAKLKTAQAVDGQRNFTGTLAGVEGDALVLECDDKVVRLPLASIDRARLVPSFDKPSRG